MTKYKVTAASGSTVNLRQMTSTNSNKVAAIAVGCIVDAAPATDGWMRVVGDGYEGYMLSKFLQPVDESADIAEKLRLLEQNMQLLSERVTALEMKGGV